MYFKSQHCYLSTKRLGDGGERAVKSLSRIMCVPPKATGLPLQTPDQTCYANKLSPVYKVMWTLSSRWETVVTTWLVLSE